MKFTSCVLLVFAVGFSKTCVDATICQPLSKFKIDCDECQCSEDGKEYSCNIKPCEPVLIRTADDKDSYDVDKPNDSSEAIDFAFVTVVKEESAELEKEDDDDDDDDDYFGIYDDSYEDDDDDDDDDDDKEWDTGLPDDYRRKRYVRPFKRYVRPGKRYIRPIRGYVRPPIRG